MDLDNPFRLEMEGKGQQWTVEALDHLMAMIGAAWDSQHNLDGSHGNVTFELGSATAYDVGIGIWMGPDNAAGLYQFRIGDPDGGYLAWDGTTLNISGSVVITGYAKTDFSNVTANYAGSSGVGGAATSLVGQGALATQNAAAWSSDVSGRPTELTDGRITTALSAAGLVISGVKPGINVTTGSAGLYLGADFMGYYNGAAWRTYMDASGNFYLGGTSGSLTWNGTTLAISGTVVSTAGTIGGWTLGASSLTGGNATLASSGNLTLGTSNDVVRVSADDGTYRLWVGHATAASAPFRVTKAGALVASDATITGAVTATSGSFTGTVTASAGTVGGWTLGASSLTGGDATLASSGNLTLGTSNDVFRASADDGTYRLWVGHATAASAPFRVSKAGVVTTGLISGDLGTTGAFSTQGACTFTISGANASFGGLVFRGTVSAGNAFWALTFHGSSGAGIFSCGGAGTGTNHHALFNNANGEIGTITSNGSTTAYNTTSDATLKKQIAIASDVKLGDLIIRDFEWVTDGAPGRGVFAQEAYPVYPEAVTPGTEGRPWMVDYSKFVPDLIAGWQQHEARLRALETS